MEVHDVRSFCQRLVQQVEQSVDRRVQRGIAFDRPWRQAGRTEFLNVDDLATLDVDDAFAWGAEAETRAARGREKANAWGVVLSGTHDSHGQK